MEKMNDKAIDRRKYIRLPMPIRVTYTIPEHHSVHTVTTTDISADGLRFQANDKHLVESTIVDLKLDMPDTPNPVHAQGQVKWAKKISLEDRAPTSIGLEFVRIEEDNKNTFLKFLCDQIYGLQKE